jgi:hypothetical protein
MALLKGRPMEDLEIWFAADQMMRSYGAGTERAADRRADVKLARGDIEGFDHLTRVVEARRLEIARRWLRQL